MKPAEGLLPGGLQIVGIRTPGLGDATYLVSYEGRGLLVDPQRDVGRFLDGFAAEDVELRWVLETHLHNDYISGGPVAAETSGAELILPAGAAPHFRHTPAFHQEDIGDGSLTIRPIHTPGHTPEHTSYLLLVEGDPVAVFSGGSLLVGSAGRPDLLGIERADTLARLQYQSVNRLAELPDGVGLYPTHGEGSFCTVSGAGQSTSTIGVEKRSNPVLAYEDADSFVKGELSALQPFPSYYRHMGHANLVGGSPLSDLALPVLDPDEVSELMTEAKVVDIRDRHRFSESHIPGSLGVELRDEFGVWVGWLLDIDQSIILVADKDQDVEEARLQLARIGYDEIEGVMFGIAGWEDSGRELSSFETVDLAGFADGMSQDVPIVDVRSPGERESRHIEGSEHVYVPDIESHGFDAFPTDEKVLVVCGTGFRANIAAGLLEEKGLSPVVLLDGGVDEVLARQPASAAV